VKPRRGFALVAALWLLVALSALGLEFSMAARDRRLAAINSVDESRALAAADAGIEVARGRLEARLRQPVAKPRMRQTGIEDPLDPWRGIERAWSDTGRLQMGRYALTIRDAGAMINVNTASEEELRRLFTALRMDAGRADRLAQLIADWRDADDAHRIRGAERDQYLRAGAPFLPENQPFRSVTELRRVLDVNDRDYASIGPYLTTRGSGRVNLRSADRAVLMSLPGVGEEAAAVIMRLRRSPSIPLTIDQVQLELSSGARAALLEHLPLLASRTVSQTRELEVVSDGWTDGGSLHVRVGTLVVRANLSTMVVGRRVE
jgi:type II secretory pathway component PulK